VAKDDVATPHFHGRVVWLVRAAQCIVSVVNVKRCVLLVANFALIFFSDGWMGLAGGGWVGGDSVRVCVWLGVSVCVDGRLGSFPSLTRSYIGD
jgi:hypothetical protein